MQFQIKALHERLNLTIIYVTHDQTEALTMSNRIAVFDGGAIQQISTPSVLYEKPENAFVASFIGENNQILGKILELNGTTCKVKVDGGIVTALSINVNAVGDKTTLSLRPERVVINPERGAAENIFEGEVLERTFLGDHFRLKIKVCGNENLGGIWLGPPVSNHA